MLISAGNLSYNKSECEVLSTDSRTICWRGLVFKSGLPAGTETVRELAGVPEKDIPQLAARLKGAYFVAMHCKDSNNAYAFVDPNGMYHAYHSPWAVGTSFLEIIGREELGANDVDPEALVEFLQFGRLHEDRTFFSSIRKIRAKEVLRYNGVGPAESLPKPVPDISQPPQRSFDALMQDFVTALRRESVSVDITGGADSRLVATALAYFGLPFEMATAGRPGIPDLEIGARVAETLGRPFYPTYHTAAHTDWNQIFRLSGGMVDVSKISRMMQLLESRKSRGITVAVSGACGELFREFWWMQDFPFYARRKPQLERLFSLRMATLPFDHSILAARYRTISETYRTKLLHRIRQFAVSSNRRTYDRVYFYFQLPSLGGSYVTASVNLLKIGLPYVDPEVIQIGYHLPLMQRVFNHFHRAATTRFSPEAARLPTTEAGVSSTSGILPFSADLSKYLVDRSKRLAKKIGQQVLRKTFFQESSDDPTVFEELRRLVIREKSAQILADHGVLNRSFHAGELPSAYLGRLFTLGELFRHLEQRDRRKLPGAAASTSERALRSV